MNLKPHASQPSTLPSRAMPTLYPKLAKELNCPDTRKAQQTTNDILHAELVEVWTIILLNLAYCKH